MRRKFLQGVSLPPMDVFAKKVETLLRAEHIVRFFYFSLLYFSILFFTRWWDVTIVTQANIDPFWPTSWMHFVDITTAVYFIRVFFVATTFLAALFPQWRFTRVLAFVGLLEFVSLYASFWKLDVDWYTWILIAFLLIFLPSGWQNSAQTSFLAKKKFLLIFFACQASLFLTYSMSALGKIVGLFQQIAAGQVHSLAMDATALHIADRLLTTNATSVFGPLVIDYPWIAWPFFIGFNFYLMLFAFWAVFRPSIHPLWAAGLILYHIGSYLTMNIGFTANILLLALFFYLSPFATQGASWRAIVLDMPLLGWLKKIPFMRRT